MQYTVRQATPTGKVDNTYGAEYIVHFNEDQREVKLSRKAPVMEGQVENGSIVDGKYGAYFKKGPFVPGQQNATPPATTAKSSASRSSYSNNSDGQRQGMCINNAASYVNTLEFPQALTDREWAELVHSYANALYRLGDLTEQSADTQVQQVADVFGVGTAPVK